MSPHESALRALLGALDALDTCSDNGGCCDSIDEMAVGAHRRRLKNAIARARELCKEPDKRPN